MDLQPCLRKITQNILWLCRKANKIITIQNASLALLSKDISGGDKLCQCQFCKLC